MLQKAISNFQWYSQLNFKIEEANNPLEKTVQISCQADDYTDIMTASEIIVMNTVLIRKIIKRHLKGKTQSKKSKKRKRAIHQSARKIIQLMCKMDKLVQEKEIRMKKGKYPYVRVDQAVMRFCNYDESEITAVRLLDMNQERHEELDEVFMTQLMLRLLEKGLNWIANSVQRCGDDCSNNHQHRKFPRKYERQLHLIGEQIVKEGNFITEALHGQKYFEEKEEASCVCFNIEIEVLQKGHPRWKDESLPITE